MKKILIITADTNDADYVTSQNEVTDEQIAQLTPMIEAIKKFKPYKGKSDSGSSWNHSSNYPSGETVREDLGQLSAQEYYTTLAKRDKDTKLVTEEEFEAFDNLVPYNEYGVHTIESITLLEVVKETKLL